MTLRINIISTCEIGYKNTLARMESDCTLRLGLSVLINNINFEVLKKFKNKFDCLVFEMLFIRTLKPSLNVQSDSIRAKVFL